jgi:hypothetical protein
MVVVMIALLAVALGVAQALVWRGGRVVVVRFGEVPGAGVPMPVNTEETLGGRPRGYRVRTEEGWRKYAAYWLRDSSGGAASDLELLSALYAHATGDLSTEPLPARRATLGGYPAVEIEGDYEPSADLAVAGLGSSTFAIMRLAVIEDQIVAICFSGSAPLAESDRQSFAAYCDHGIQIKVERRTPRRN